MFYGSFILNIRPNLYQIYGVSRCFIENYIVFCYSYILHTCAYVSYIIQWLKFAGLKKTVLREIDCIKMVYVAQ